MNLKKRTIYTQVHACYSTNTKICSCFFTILVSQTQSLAARSDEDDKSILVFQNDKETLVLTFAHIQIIFDGKWLTDEVNACI